MEITKKYKISEIVSLLKKGGVVVLPTETSYGFSCDSTNKEAVKKIYNIKGRPKKKAVLLICADLKMVKKHFKMSPKEIKLASKYWPGSLSLILDDVGVRVPAHKLCRQISKKLNRPIVSTSANLTDKPPCYSVKCIVEQLKNKKHQPDLIINGGRLKKVNSSTIIKVKKGKVKVLREGPICISETS
ncbi:MAG: L-threonylcarbamoyladenylate synthase [Patescibacteria group bacterium]|nr:L-threonylcarbamoyladenylate synthase [Patescibacteria group bacterium]